jgi:hypothetical protein
MLSRGFIGAMPKLADEKESKLAIALILPAAAALISISTGVLL